MDNRSPIPNQQDNGQASSFWRRQWNQFIQKTSLPEFILFLVAIVTSIATIFTVMGYDNDAFRVFRDILVIFVLIGLLIWFYVRLTHLREYHRKEKEIYKSKIADEKFSTERKLENVRQLYEEISKHGHNINHNLRDAMCELSSIGEKHDEECGSCLQGIQHLYEDGTIDEEVLSDFLC